MPVKTTIDSSRGVVQEQGDGTLIIDVPIQANQALVSNTATTVATLSSLPSANLQDGTRYYVSSVGDVYEYRLASSASVFFNSVLTASNGGRWLRLGMPSTQWLSQDTWYIDPINGSDDNVGTTSVSAIKSWNELSARFGSERILAKTTTVNLLNSSPAIDPIMLNVGLAQSASLILSGALTLIRTGTFTSITNLTRSTNTAVTASDSNMTTGWASDQFRLCLISGGARGGAAAWVAKDINTTTAIFSPFQSASIATTTTQTPTLTLVNPSAGDNYSVYSLPSASYGNINIRPVFDLGRSGYRADTISFEADPSFTPSVNIVSDLPIRFHRCRSRQQLQNNNPGSNTLNLYNCHIFSTFTNVGATTNILGGLINSGTSANGGTVAFSNDAFIHYPGTGSQTQVIVSANAPGRITMNNVGLFDWTGGSGVVGINPNCSFGINGPIYGGPGQIVLFAQSFTTIASTITTFSGTITFATGTTIQFYLGNGAGSPVNGIFTVTSGTATASIPQRWDMFDVDQPVGFRIPGTKTFSAVNFPMNAWMTTTRIA